MKKQPIHTDQSPQAIGTYSQAMQVGNTIYISGQIPLLAATMEIISDDIRQQIHQVFSNLSAVTAAAGGNLNHIVKLNIYLTDLADFPMVNEIMLKYFTQPYPARAVVGVVALPKNVRVEMEAVMVVD